MMLADIRGLIWVSERIGDNALINELHHLPRDQAYMVERDLRDRGASIRTAEACAVRRLRAAFGRGRSTYSERCCCRCSTRCARSGLWLSRSTTTCCFAGSWDWAWTSLFLGFGLPTTASFPRFPHVRVTGFCRGLFNFRVDLAADKESRACEI
jgi:hypothetical protein